MKTRKISANSGLVIATLLLVAGCASSYSEPSEIRRERRTVLTAKDIDDLPPASTIEELIVRHIPGTQMFARSDGRMGLIITGLSNSRTSGSPLVVIDGIPQDGSAGVELSPRDIERIEILKEGGSTAMYGFRGANGVVMIETKKGG